MSSTEKQSNEAWQRCGLVRVFGLVVQAIGSGDFDRNCGGPINANYSVFSADAYTSTVSAAGGPKPLNTAGARTNGQMRA